MVLRAGAPYALLLSSDHTCGTYRSRTSNRPPKTPTSRAKSPSLFSRAASRALRAL